MENALPTGGQKRLSIGEIKDELLCHFYLEKGFLFTFYYMIKNPEKLIFMYLQEDRKKVFNPFRYLLFGVAATTLILLSHPSFKKLVDSIQSQHIGEYEALAEATKIPFWDIMLRMQEIYMSYQNIIIIISIPVVSFITMKFFRNHSFNYAENMAINSFVFGTIYWVSAILGLLTFFTDSGGIMYMATGVTFVASTYLFKRIFKNSVLRSFAGIVLSYIPIFLIGIFAQIIIFITLIILF